jgi:lactate dehydrogenase-like 2-hydroxyacid dehydrogenase
MVHKATRIAILDDYQGLSAPYLAKLPSPADITVYKDNIWPEPDPSALIERLKPYDVISTMRERTLLRRNTLEQLPNLKVILMTGMNNRGIDLDYCKEKGIVVAGTPGRQPA